MRLGDLGDGVGGHDPARRARSSVGAGGHRRHGGDAGEHAVDRVAAADHPGRRDEHVAGAQPRRAATASTSASASASPAGPLATLAFLDTTTTARARPSARLRRLIDHARPGEAAAREHAGRGTGDVGGEHDEVVGVVLDADVGDVGARSRRAARSRTSGACRRAAGVELGADGRRRSRPSATMSSAIEQVDHVAAHAGDVVGGAVSSSASPSVGELRRASPGGRGRTAARSTRPLCTRPSRRRVSPLGESCSGSARSHMRIVVLVGLGEVHEHLVVAERQAVAGRGRSRAPPSGPMAVSV